MPPAASTRRRAHALLALGLVAAICGCGDDLVPAHLAGDDGSQREALCAESAMLVRQTQLRVCWLTPGHATEKAWVHEAIDDSWNALTNLRFVGWGPCTPASGLAARGAADVQVAILDAPGIAPRVVALGGPGAPKAMILNMTFRAWGHAWPAHAGGRRAAIKAIAMHEFGHVMGFAHEHNRPDVDGAFCDAPPQGMAGNFLVTAPDGDSIMSYCSGGRRLSEGDMRGAQRLYGVNRDLYVWPRFYADVTVGRGDGPPPGGEVEHYRRVGAAAGELATPWLDPVWYRAHARDMAPCATGPVGVGWSAVSRYIPCGLARGHAGSLYWDPVYYLAANPDVARAVGPDNYLGALRQWRAVGIAEGRAGSATFSPRAYLAAHPALARAVGRDNFYAALVHHARGTRARGPRA